MASFVRAMAIALGIGGVCLVAALMAKQASDATDGQPASGTTPREMRFDPPPSRPAPAAPKEDATDQTIRRLLSGNATDEELRFLVAKAADSKGITFAHLKKNAARYKGTEWRFKGHVIEIGENEGNTVARIALDSWANDVVWVEAGFLTDFVENNRVEVLGIVVGAKSYTSQAGWNISIPAMVAYVIDKPGTIDKRLGIKAKPKKPFWPEGMQGIE